MNTQSIDLTPQLPPDDTERPEAPVLGSLPALLRLLGASVLLAAAATFLVQRWPDADFILRYYFFLAFTLLLSAAGFFCGVRLGDRKGARTFLWVAAAIIPVHFCQLGAFAYSSVAVIDPSRYPAYALWVAPSKLTALSTIAAGLAGLIPVALLSFATLARRRAGALTAMYIGLNSLLLVPTRDPALVGLLYLTAICAVLVFELRTVRATSALSTREGIAARLMLAAPPVLLVLRTLHLYRSTDLFVSALLAGVALCFFFLPRTGENDADRRTFGEILSMVPATLSSIFFSGYLIKYAQFGNEAALAVLMIPLALLYLVVSPFVTRHGECYWSVGTQVLTFYALTNLAQFGQTLNALICVVVGIFAVASACLNRGPWLLWLGAATFITGIVYTMREAFLEIYAFSPWASLALVGVITLLFSSLLERYGAVLKSRIDGLRRRYRPINVT